MDMDSLGRREGGSARGRDVPGSLSIHSALGPVNVLRLLPWCCMVYVECALSAVLLPFCVFR